MPIRHITELNPYDTNCQLGFSGEQKHRKEELETEKLPPEGPHAKPELIDEEKTPGSGTFPKPGNSDNQAPTG
jgi:hypothetical protein